MRINSKTVANILTLAFVFGQKLPLVSYRPKRFCKHQNVIYAYEPSLNSLHHQSSCISRRMRVMAAYKSGSDAIKR